MAAVTVDLLYKYGCLTRHSEAFFSTPTVHFSPPPKLNDPFECRPWFTFDGQRDEVVETLAKMFRKFQRLTHHEATAQAVAAYLQGRHRTPRMWEELRRDVIAMLGKNIGLCCLSQVPDSILMWSHYGLDHAGFCVEFEATDHTPIFGAAQPVLYCDTYPTVDFFTTPNDEQVDLIFLTKYLGWSYEQEWRVIDHENGPGSHEYPPELMKSVIFGLRMPNDTKKKIREWVSRRGKPVRFLQALQHPRKFAIELVELA